MNMFMNINEHPSLLKGRLGAHGILSFVLYELDIYLVKTP